MPVFIVYRWDGTSGLADMCCAPGSRDYRSTFAFSASALRGRDATKVYVGARLLARVRRRVDSGRRELCLARVF